MSLTPAALPLVRAPQWGGWAGLESLQSTSVLPWPAFSDPKPASLPFGPTPFGVSCLGCLGLGSGKAQRGQGLPCCPWMSGTLWALPECAVGPVG